MMGDFFAFETELSKNSGFSLFGGCHAAWLLGMSAVGIFFVKWYCKSSIRKRNRIKHTMAVVMPAMALYRDGILFITGHFGKGFLPLHLCGMALWMAPLYIATKKRFIGVIYVLLCVPGAMGALLFPDWNMYPVWNYMHIHAFLSHGILVIFGMALLISGELLPEWREVYEPIVFGITGAICVYRLNESLHTNYWFLNVPPKNVCSGALSYIAGTGWYPVGIVAVGVAVVFVWMTIIRAVTCWRANKKTENGCKII